MKRIRYGFSIIELIMTIVVIGIAFIGVPLILENSAKTAAWVERSKGVYHGLSKVQIIRSKFWDEGNENDFINNGIYYVLKTAESNAIGETLYCSYDTNRSGHYSGDGRRKCSGATATASGNFGETGDLLEGVGTEEWDDIDDYHEEDDSSVDGKYDIATKVKYITYSEGINSSNITLETDAGDTSNLKEIIVTVSANGKRISEYRYYAANIGVPRPYIKSNN